MLNHQKRNLLRIGYACAATWCILRLPVVQSGDKPYWSTDPSWTRAWIWELSRPDLHVQWGYAMAIQLALLGVAAGLYALLATRREKMEALALVYVVAALGRLIFVPCVWPHLYGLRVFPGLVESGTLPLWRVGTEQIRYGLVAFEEVALLAFAAALLLILRRGMFTADRTSTTHS